MASQADLFAPVMTPPKAPEGRAGPRLWVRRLAIFKDRQTIIAFFEQLNRAAA